jgi:hypothetical protein
VPVLTSVPFLGGQLAGVQASAIVGQPFAGVVATLSGSGLQSLAASIVWGDGHISAGTIAIDGASEAVSGSNTYASTGTFSIFITLWSPGGDPVEVQGILTVVPATAGQGQDHAQGAGGAGSSQGGAEIHPGAFVPSALTTSDVVSGTPLSVVFNLASTGNGPPVSLSPTTKPSPGGSGNGNGAQNSYRSNPGVLVAATGGQEPAPVTFSPLRPAPAPVTDTSPWFSIREHQVNPLPSVAATGPVRSLLSSPAPVTDPHPWAALRDQAVHPAMLAAPRLVPDSTDLNALLFFAAVGLDAQPEAPSLFAPSVYALAGMESLQAMEVPDAAWDTVGRVAGHPPTTLPGATAHARSTGPDDYVQPLYRVADRAELAGWPGELTQPLFTMESSAGPAPLLPMPWAVREGVGDATRCFASAADGGGHEPSVPRRASSKRDALSHMAQAVLQVASAWFLVHALHGRLPRQTRS